jgi:hypothetical protein
MAGVPIIVEVGSVNLESRLIEMKSERRTEADGGAV